MDITPKLKRFLQLSISQQTRRHLPLMSEFKEFVHLDKPTDAPYLKLLVTPPTQGSETESPKRIRTTYKYGVWRTPSECLEEAMGTSHPVDSISVSPVTKSAIDFVVKNEPVDVAKYRLRTIIDIKRLQKDLADEDSSIKRSMDIKLRKRLQNKVMNLLTEGVPLVGCDDSSRGFDRHMVPATLTPEELLKSSLWRRKAIMGSHKSIDEKDINSRLETSNDEVTRGFLEGLFQKARCQITLDSRSDY